MGFPDLLNVTCPSSWDNHAGPRHPHEQDEANDPALPARDVRRDRVGGVLVGGPCS